MSSSIKTIVWFRRDLRIEDNPALAAAAARDAACALPVFIWCPDEEGRFCPGRVSRWWLKQSLVHLDRSLRLLGSPLVLIRSESTLAALLQCVKAIGATKVIFNHLYGTQNRPLHSCSSLPAYAFYLNFVFQTRFRSCEITKSRVSSQPSGFLSKAITPICCTNHGKSATRMSTHLRPSTHSGRSAWTCQLSWHHLFLPQYSTNRMKVEGATTSLLSPYLEAEESVRLFLRSIGLREYSRYICFNFPFTHERSLMGNLRHYPWCEDETKFKCWRQGRTGYPLVDAGMRELWATGWIHNRVRVVVASFLVKFLLIPWTWGMKYFWETLLDADLENDILGWQYVSGSLPDGHELDRLDSPQVRNIFCLHLLFCLGNQIQGHKFDPDGKYVRNWIPELIRLPTEWIHHPWDAPTSVLDAAGVELGANYPKPIVDINTAREHLDDAVSTMWKLDTAEKMVNSIEKGEVADNLIDMNTLDIPKVAVRKEVSCASASLDRRVPSFHNVEGKPSDNRSKDADDQRQIQPELDSQVQMTTIDKCSFLTAESLTSRKRSIGGSLSTVPDTCLSSSEVNTVKVYASHTSTGSSLHLWQETGQLGAEKEEDDVDAETSNNMLRPTKRTG